MRIVLANNRWFMVGGTTRYVFGIQALLEEHGHTVLPFSNRYSQTLDDVDTRWFVAPPGGRDSAFYHEEPLTLRHKWGLFRRGVHDPAVRDRLGEMLRAERAELLYSVNIANFLGPGVRSAAREAGVPHVMRLSDFNLLCPAYNFVRGGQPCEDCMGGLHHAIRHRCLQGSLPVTLARVVAMWSHRLTRCYDDVQAMVTPTAFLRGKLVEGGFDPDRIHHIPTFFAGEAPGDHHGAGGEVVFAGRLAPEKGVHTLVEAMGRIPAGQRPQLRLLGAGEERYEARLRELATRLGPGDVAFEGMQPREAVLAAMRGASVVAVPSEWYENMPNSLVEAMALACPIVTNRLGSLPEQVEHGVHGRLATPGDAGSLAAELAWCLDHPEEARALGRTAHEKVRREYSPARHYEALAGLFRAVKGEPA